MEPFLRLIGVLVCAVAGPALAGAQEPDLVTESLGSGLHVIRSGPGGNILVTTGDDGAFLIDAQSASLANRVVEAVAAITSQPVRMVLNTHYHEDHIGGNAAFRHLGAVILAQRNATLRATVDTTIDELDWHREAANPSSLPMISLDGTAGLALNGHVVQVLAFENAHTDGDLAFFFHDANLVHVGDIVEVGAYPFIDWWGGGSVSGMIAAVDRFIELADDETRILPGHGPVVDRSHLIAYRGMLDTVRGRVADAIARGLSLDGPWTLD